MFSRDIFSPTNNEAGMTNGHSIDNILKCYGIKDPGKYSK